MWARECVVGVRFNVASSLEKRGKPFFFCSRRWEYEERKKSIIGKAEKSGTNDMMKKWRYKSISREKVFLNYHKFWQNKQQHTHTHSQTQIACHFMKRNLLSGNANTYDIFNQNLVWLPTTNEFFLFLFTSHRTVCAPHNQAYICWLMVFPSSRHETRLHVMFLL